MSFDQSAYDDLLTVVNGATTNNEKGAAFEDLCSYLFNCIEGVEVVERNAQMSSEEIDLVLWNAQIIDELRAWDDVILVECKNWSKPVDAKYLDNFINKMRRRDRKTGIFIAASGVTGSFVTGATSDLGAVGIIKSALRDGIKVITLRMDDLREIKSVDNLKDVIKRRYCKLFVHKVF